MRIGVYGGTFDPVHLGHLVLAEQCRDQAKLDRVLFIPAARPPHKQQQATTPFDKRVEMLALAIAGQPAFQIDELEKDRPGPSFTVETLAALKARQPGDDLFLLVGSDTLHDLPQWYEPRRVLEMTTLLVVERADWPVFTENQLRDSLQLPAAFPLRFQAVQAPLVTIASRDVRRQIAAGRSVRYQIPRAVEAYIADKGLYRGE